MYNVFLHGNRVDALSKTPFQASLQATMDTTVGHSR